MRTLPILLLVSALLTGCLPSRRGQQPEALSGGQAPIQAQGPRPTVPAHPNQPQPQPRPQPGSQPPASGGAGSTLPMPGQGGGVDPAFPPAWAGLEDEVAAEVNARRARGAVCGGQAFGPAAPLSVHPGLRQAARLHSRDMATRNYFDHTSLDGRQMGDRLRAAGYSGKSYGENIASGEGTARATVEQWMASPGHCSNIMDPGFRYIGVGYAFAQNSRFGHYWTQDFGS